MGKKKLELEINSFWEVAEKATEARKFRARNKNFFLVVEFWKKKSMKVKQFSVEEIWEEYKSLKLKKRL
jgi:hypothetical protein